MVRSLLYSVRAYAYLKLGHKKKAISDCSTGISIYEISILRFMRASLWKDSRPKDALNDINVAIKKSPNDPNYYRVRASIYKTIGGNRAKEIADIEKAKELENKNSSSK